jgi:hypothetical protein
MDEHVVARAKYFVQVLATSVDGATHHIIVEFHV